MKPETEDRREEDALASIFGKKNYTDESPFFSNELDKTTVIEKIPQTAKPHGFKIEAVRELEDEDDYNSEQEITEEENEEDDKPFRVENTVFDKTRKKRKKDYIREQNIRRAKARQSQKTFLNVFGGIILVVLIIAASAYLSYYIIEVALDFTGITTNEFEIEVEIPRDATTEQIAEILKRDGLIRNPRFFSLYSQLFGYDNQYLDGLFILESSMSYGSLIRALQSVAYVRQTVTVTITEGMTAEEIGLLLEESFVCLASDFEVFYKTKQNVFSFEKRLSMNSMKFHQLEGYLFPDTYEFFVSDELRDGVDIEALPEKERSAVAGYAKTAANKIYDNFNAVITREMYKTMNEKGFTLDELMTLASMVQAEAADIDDMRWVASVFINRLNYSETFPKMQSDPTGYYADNFIKPHVTQRNIGLYQPVMDAYDTYLSSGLPPGPICNPGTDAIMAVLEAPPSSYFYFCANIETGMVYYSETEDQHNEYLALIANQMGLTNN